MSDSAIKLADWTTGGHGIVYQSCCACEARQYFKRAFCCACGSTDVELRQASGEGVVYATSLVLRAGTPETRAHAPYNIILVDLPEGFRMMAHGANDLAIGDRVTATFRQFTDHIVPFFERTGS